MGVGLDGLAQETDKQLHHKVTQADFGRRPPPLETLLNPTPTVRHAAAPPLTSTSNASCQGGGILIHAARLRVPDPGAPIFGLLSVVVVRPHTPFGPGPPNVSVSRVWGVWMVWVRFVARSDRA